MVSSIKLQKTIFGSILFTLALIISALIAAPNFYAAMVEDADAATDINAILNFRSMITVGVTDQGAEIDLIEYEKIDNDNTQIVVSVDRRIGYVMDVANTDKAKTVSVIADYIAPETK